VNVKANEQQEIQALHRIRERLARDRTGLFKQTRGLLAKNGVVFAAGKKQFPLGIEKVLNE